MAPGGEDEVGDGGRELPLGERAGDSMVVGLDGLEVRTPGPTGLFFSGFISSGELYNFL